ncbi:hypothetical protein [Sediminicurvatus halobius]
MRNGTRHGIQHWLCRECERSCTVATGTALSHLRRRRQVRGLRPGP